MHEAACCMHVTTGFAWWVRFA